MGFNEFWLQSNNGKKLSLEKLKELKKSNLKDKPKLIKLFDFFNTNKSKGSEDVLDKQELASLFNMIQTYAESAKGKNTSIFETEEVEEYINEAVVENQALKDLGIKVLDLFEFLSALVQKK